MATVSGQEQESDFSFPWEAFILPILTDMNIYLDTSVIGGYYDEKFKKETRKLFDDFQTGKHVPVLSSVTVGELLRGALKK